MKNKTPAVIIRGCGCTQQRESALAFANEVIYIIKNGNRNNLTQFREVNKNGEMLIAIETSNGDIIVEYLGVQPCR